MVLYWVMASFSAFPFGGGSCLHGLCFFVLLFSAVIGAFDLFSAVFIFLPLVCSFRAFLLALCLLRLKFCLGEGSVIPLSICVGLFVRGPWPLAVRFLWGGVSRHGSTRLSFSLGSSSSRLLVFLAVLMSSSSSSSVSFLFLGFECVRGFDGSFVGVASYGTGAQIKLPGRSLHEPNVYGLGTPYKVIHDGLRRKELDLYKRNGLLPMLKRKCTVKTAPQCWQENAGDEPSDVVFTFEEKFFDLVLEGMWDLEAKQLAN